MNLAAASGRGIMMENILFFTANGDEFTLRPPTGRLNSPSILLYHTT